MKRRIAVVAALEREVEPLVKGWRSAVRAYEMRAYKIYSKDDVSLVCGGIGQIRATRAAKAIVTFCDPEILISAGLAGATNDGMKVGAPLTAETVIDTASGKRYQALFGGGVLASAPDILGPTEKRDLAGRFGAHAVDMEAAAVAEVADSRGLPFLAVKAISDEADFEMPPLQQFVDEEGQIETGRLVAYAAMRPGMWRSLRTLAANSAAAAETLRRVLASLIEAKDLLKMTVGDGRLVAR